jgi:uncharacterized protein YndB with AHSA1/START domain
MTKTAREITNKKGAMMNIERAPAGKAAMLIRRPVSDVFEAFVNPAITTKFWFSKSSGRLEEGKTVRWDWEMFGASTDVKVTAIELNKRIVIEWGDAGKTSKVEWLFASKPEGTTFVSVTDSGFRGSGDEIVEQALDSTGGFTLVLAGLKSLLEHHTDLNLIRDRFPDGHPGA